MHILNVYNQNVCYVKQMSMDDKGNRLQQNNSGSLTTFINAQSNLTKRKRNRAFLDDEPNQPN